MPLSRPNAINAVLPADNSAHLSSKHRIAKVQHMSLAPMLKAGNHTNMQTRVVTKALPETIPALKEEQIAEVAEILRLLGEASRLRVLLACLAGPASVGEIALRAGMARSLASHHLRVLRASRLLRAKRNGKQMIYTPADDRVRCIVVDLAAHVLETDDDQDE
jgi:DNA-binding transcriptional ArsR family regulator